MLKTCEIKTAKVPGGIGVDEWEAVVNVSNDGVHAMARGRGETRQLARQSLLRSMHEMMRDLAAIYAELQTTN